LSARSRLLFFSKASLSKLSHQANSSEEERGGEYFQLTIEERTTCSATVKACRFGLSFSARKALMRLRAKRVAPVRE
jgi:hypothetical protein